MSFFPSLRSSSQKNPFGDCGSFGSLARPAISAWLFVNASASTCRLWLGTAHFGVSASLEKSPLPLTEISGVQDIWLTRRFLTPCLNAEPERRLGTRVQALSSHPPDTSLEPPPKSLFEIVIGLFNSPVSRSMRTWFQASTP